MTSIDNSTFAKKINNYNKAKLAENMYSNGTLRNKLGIKNANKLSDVEFNGSAKRMDTILKLHKPVTNIYQLKAIHHFMFGFIYSWAGVVRNYDISKSSHNFLPYSVMNTACHYTNTLIDNINNKRKPNVKDYAKLLDTINEMHPFREGNGRSTKCFIQNLAINKGQFIQYHVDEREAIKGLNSSNINLIAKNMKLEKLNHSAKQRLHFIVVNEEQQGWEPNQKEIKNLEKFDNHPNQKVLNEAENFSKNTKNA